MLCWILNCLVAFLFCTVPRGGRLLVSCVPMREQKNDEKGYFFRAGQYAALSSFRVGKCYFCRKRVCVLQILQKVAE